MKVTGVVKLWSLHLDGEIRRKGKVKDEENVKGKERVKKTLRVISRIFEKEIVF